MENIDIYFSREWQELYAERGNMELDGVSFNCDLGSVKYNFLKRPVVIHGKSYPYMDILTPYAYSGPLLFPAEDTSECVERLVNAFDLFLDEYCREHRIVAEYVQFNPWIGNDTPFKRIYQMDWQIPSRIVSIDLTKPDLMMDELNARRRRSVRNAQKQDVKVGYDYQGELMDEFMRLYQFTLDKYDVTEYDTYTRDFVQKVFQKMKGQVYFAYCLYEGECVSICMVLESKNYIHYHLAGHNPNKLHTNASSLLIYSLACKAQQEKKKKFILGVSGTEQLEEFKLSFTRNSVFDYLCGRKIRDPVIYEMLVQINGVTESKFSRCTEHGNRLILTTAIVQEDA